MSYQSHDGEKATSNSARKLERIRLPANLTGKRVLDIGCNEGFFSAEAIRRGATTVVGIDTNEAAVTFAREHYANTGAAFLVQSWYALPPGPFDVVLWLSAMHYERDPAAMFRRISDILAPNGLFILECGVYPDTVGLLQMVPVARPADLPLYPTDALLQQMLSEVFAVRPVAEGEKTPGDPVPRHVFHCRHALPTVLLIRAGSEQGKSSLAARLGIAATKVIRLDYTLPPLARAGLENSALLKYTREHVRPDNLEPFYRGIDDAGLTDAYIDFVLRGIAPTDRMVLIEGFMTDRQAETLAVKLRSRAVVWDVTRKT